MTKPSRACDATVRLVEVATDEVEQLCAHTRAVALSAGEATVILRAADATVLDWTTYYCNGSFRVSEHLGLDSDVLVTSRSDLLTLLDDLLTHEWYHTQHWASLRSAATGVTIVRQGTVYYLLGLDGGRVLVATREADEVRRMAAVRTVRSLILQRLLETGWMFMHAASASLGGRCVIVTGSKFSGKTTMLLGLMQNGMDLVSNDKVALRQSSNGSVQVQGFPIAVGVRLGTFSVYSTALGLLSAAREGPPASLVERRIRTAPDVSTVDTKIRFDPQRLARACGVGVVSPRCAAAVIVPFHRPDAPFSLRYLEPAAAVETVRAMCLYDLAELSPEHAFLSRAVCDGASPRKILEDIVREIPVFSVEHNCESVCRTVAFVRDMLT